MFCRYGNVHENRGNYLATIGNFLTEFEGYFLPDYPEQQCFFTKEEIENMDFDILEVVEIKDKHKGYQEFIQMAIRWGAKVDDIIKMPYTHEEKVKIANNFLENVRKIPYVSSAKIVGSVAKAIDEPMSDVDIAITTKTCPDEKKCEIAKLIRYYILEPLDIYCSTENSRK